MSARECFDVVVVGGGPAGAVAAIRAAALKLRTLLVERQTAPRPVACCGWIGPAGVSLSRDCGLTEKAAGAERFAGLTLHSWDFRHQAPIQQRELSGWLVDRARFDPALRQRAAEAGVQVCDGASPQGLRLGEQEVELTLSNGRVPSGAVVIIADGVDSETARLAHLAGAREHRRLPMGLYADWPTGGAAQLHLVLGKGRPVPLGIVVRTGTRTRAAVLTSDPQSAEQQWREFVEGARRAGLLPASGAAPVQRPCPAGLALDMETHVGKRCLLVGDAGGFAACFSYEGIYPGMRSGWLAAEAAAQALKAPVFQDALAQFDLSWRTALADYLRAPHTDLALLLPLVFSNPQMSGRLARALLTGRAL